MTKIFRSFLAVIFFASAHCALAEESFPNIFITDFVWKNSDGKSVSLKDFRGKKVVFSMVYTSCQSACPLITKKMKKIESKLKEAKVSAQFVVVSFDSENDNTERLKHFQTHNDLASDHWQLMTGSEKDTRSLANMLDIKFSKRPGSNEIMHDNKIILFDESGKIVRVLDGLKTEKMELF